MNHFRRSAEVRPVEMLPGVFRRTMTTTSGMMLCEITLDAEVPEHQHPHEQIGYVTQGQIDLTIAGETRTLSAGDAYAIPGGTPHKAAPHGGRCVVIDVFSPHREDYR